MPLETVIRLLSPENNPDLDSRMSCSKNHFREEIRFLWGYQVSSTSLAQNNDSAYNTFLLQSFSKFHLTYEGELSGKFYVFSLPDLDYFKNGGEIVPKEDERWQMFGGHQEYKTFFKTLNDAYKRGSVDGAEYLDILSDINSYYSVYWNNRLFRSESSIKSHLDSLRESIANKE